MKPLVTIAIPTYTRSDLLSLCLAGLAAQTVRGFEVIVVDNAGPVPVGRVAGNGLPAVTVRRMQRNLFFAGAAAAGLADATTPYVATLNDDAIPEAAWLEEVLSSLEANDSVASVASKVLRFDDPRTLDSAGDILTVSGRAANRGWGQPDGAEFNIPVDVFSASGCCAIYK